MVYIPYIDRLSKENQDCINCETPYDHTLGGLVWHGYKRQYFVCPKCAPMLVAGLANDLAEMLYNDYGENTPRAHYIPYLQRAAHAIQVKNGQTDWGEVMDRKGVITNNVPSRLRK